MACQQLKVEPRSGKRKRAGAAWDGKCWIDPEEMPPLPHGSDAAIIAQSKAVGWFKTHLASLVPRVVHGFKLLMGDKTVADSVIWQALAEGFVARWGDFFRPANSDDLEYAIKTEISRMMRENQPIPTVHYVYGAGVDETAIINSLIWCEAALPGLMQEVLKRLRDVRVGGQQEA